MPADRVEDIKIPPIRNGTVIDHITDGQSLNVLKILGVNENNIDSSISIGIHVSTNKAGMKWKDIVKLEDSSATAKAGENPNLYLIHDDDLLKVINELRAAGAEAISINGQRLIGTSEIRCAGPTLSVNNVRSAPPFEIRAIGDSKSLESAIRMRGGVAETLKVWGIQLEVSTSSSVYVPAYKGSASHTYAHETEEKEGESK